MALTIAVILLILLLLGLVSIMVCLSSTTS
jgi:hypothetical protein